MQVAEREMEQVVSMSLQLPAALQRGIDEGIAFADDASSKFDDIKATVDFIFKAAKRSGIDFDDQDIANFEKWEDGILDRYQWLIEQSNKPELVALFEDHIQVRESFQALLSRMRVTSQRIESLRWLVEEQRLSKEPKGDGRIVMSRGDDISGYLGSI
ncbi:hypothetical protein R84981_002759 [Carnimonas sp. R-84981]|uniref:hypothetical protein n=1 Tax=Carnimonas bestiolae TaxID=3402172 RepID=UPI003EDC3619